MATIGNFMYDRCKLALPSAELNWETDTIKAAALTDAYAFIPTHSSFDDLVGVLDVVDVDDRTLTTDGQWLCSDLDPGPVLPNGQYMRRVVFFLDTGVPTTSLLLLYQDQNQDLSPINRLGLGAAVVVPYPNPVYRLT